MQFISYRFLQVHVFLPLVPHFHYDDCFSEIIMMRKALQQPISCSLWQFFGWNLLFCSEDIINGTAPAGLSVTWKDLAFAEVMDIASQLKKTNRFLAFLQGLQVPEQTIAVYISICLSFFNCAAFKIHFECFDLHLFSVIVCN